MAIETFDGLSASRIVTPPQYFGHAYHDAASGWTVDLDDVDEHGTHSDQSLPIANDEMLADFPTDAYLSVTVYVRHDGRAQLVSVDGES